MRARLTLFCFLFATLLVLSVSCAEVVTVPTRTPSNPSANVASAVASNPVQPRRVLPKMSGAPPEPKPFQMPLESNEKAFTWDEVQKTYEAKPGELLARFNFSFTNITSKEVAITSVHTSCGCTVATLPTMPWPIPAGGNGNFDVTTDLKGKTGTIAKTVTIESSAGVRILHVTSIIPTNLLISAADRERNSKLATADRQAVFKNDCATCHVKPAEGKAGKELYTAACGICHEAEHRASMVPSLRALNKPTDAGYWTMWISQGKTNTLMPAFAKGAGGPLDGKQIRSLVDFLQGEFKDQKQAASLSSAK